jgi:hypothetical protein
MPWESTIVTHDPHCDSHSSLAKSVGHSLQLSAYLAINSHLCAPGLPNFCSDMTLHDVTLPDVLLCSDHF